VPAHIPRASDVSLEQVAEMPCRPTSAGTTDRPPKANMAAAQWMQPAVRTSPDASCSGNSTTATSASEHRLSSPQAADLPGMHRPRTSADTSTASPKASVSTLTSKSQPSRERVLAQRGRQGIRFAAELQCLYGHQEGDAGDERAAGNHDMTARRHARRQQLGPHRELLCETGAPACGVRSAALVRYPFVITVPTHRRHLRNQPGSLRAGDLVGAPSPYGRRMATNVSATSGSGAGRPQPAQAGSAAQGPPAQPNPLAVIRSPAYLRLLVVAVLIGVPIAAAAFGFLKLTTELQSWTYTDLPKGLGYSSPPSWWPLLPLGIAGLVVGLTIRYLPGRGGASPADGFAVHGPPTATQLPGVLLAALASVGLGAVVGPEAPLIALGGGLAILAVRLGRRDVPAQAAAVVAATGSFAALSTLLGSPIAGAFLLLEAIGVGGTMATAVLLPGLLGAGVGALIFTGLDSLTGYGTFSLAVPDLPSVGAPTGAEFGWAILIGLAAGPVCVALRWLALTVRDRIVTPWLVPATVVVGLAVAGLAIAYFEATGHPPSDVLFSGQTALPVVLDTANTYTVGALLLLLLCKGLAYSLSLSSFRGGPTFPAMFLGAAGGVALSHLPGLPLVPAAGIGIGAMTAAMLRLPMTAVLLATLFLGSDGFPVMPLTIVAAVVAYVTAVWLTPAPRTHDQAVGAGPP
jgi:H+/Cl- antiporter ClcA